ncbi:unnamed protein product, partial [Amoebophrya sp. A120]|eukprot:GSA120T00012491001.1
MPGSYTDQPPGRGAPLLCLSTRPASKYEGPRAAATWGPVLPLPLSNARPRRRRRRLTDVLGPRPGWASPPPGLAHLQAGGVYWLRARPAVAAAPAAAYPSCARPRLFCVPVRGPQRRDALLAVGSVCAHSCLQCFAEK